MTSQDIFKAIISDDNVGLLESVNTVLYEKSNLLVEDYKVVVAQNIMNENGNADYKDAMSMAHRKDAAQTAKFKHSANMEIENDERNQENSIYNRNIKFQNRDKRYTSLSQNELRILRKNKDIERQRAMWSAMQDRKQKSGRIHQSIH